MGCCIGVAAASGSGSAAAVERRGRRAEEEAAVVTAEGVPAGATLRETDELAVAEGEMVSNGSGDSRPTGRKYDVIVGVESLRSMRRGFGRGVAGDDEVGLLLASGRRVEVRRRRG